MKTVVLLSGGLDSAVVLAMALRDGEVSALTIDYGQRHRREIESAKAVADYYAVPHLVAKVDPAVFGGSALTCDREVPDGAAVEPDATYVPARNTVLLALATARAESIGARCIAIGANADDAGGYPDCRRKYLESFREVLLTGTVGHVWLTAPLLGYAKNDVVDLARQIGVPIELTWSCYRGGDDPCGTCGACELRNEAMR